MFHFEIVSDNARSQQLSNFTGLARLAYDATACMNTWFRSE